MQPSVPARPVCFRLALPSPARFRPPRASVRSDAASRRDLSAKPGFVLGPLEPMARTPCDRRRGDEALHHCYQAFYLFQCHVPDSPTASRLARTPLLRNERESRQAIRPITVRIPPIKCPRSRCAQFKRPRSGHPQSGRFPADGAKPRRASTTPGCAPSSPRCRARRRQTPCARAPRAKTGRTCRRAAPRPGRRAPWGQSRPRPPP